MLKNLCVFVSLWFLPYVAVSASQQQGDPAPDPIQVLVQRLDLEKYKATIKGLTPFGDRRQGTDRNHAAVDWIEAQLKTYGCTNTERITYDFQPRPPAPRAANAPPPLPTGVVGPQTATASGGGRPRGIRTGTGVNTDPMKQ